MCGSIQQQYFLYSHAKDAALAGLLKMQTKLEVDVAELQGSPNAELENLKELQNILRSVTEAAEKEMEALQVSLVVSHSYPGGRHPQVVRSCNDGEPQKEEAPKHRSLPEFVSMSHLGRYQKLLFKPIWKRISKSSQSIFYRKCLWTMRTVVRMTKLLLCWN